LEEEARKRVAANAAAAADDDERRKQATEAAERQALLLEQRIARLRAEEAEAIRKAKQSETEAASKAAAAAKITGAALPSYWQTQDPSAQLSKVELTADPKWPARFQELLDGTCRRGTLGQGRDQVIKSGKYDRLVFHRAWRLENPKLYSLYAAHRDTQLDTPPVQLSAKTHELPSSAWIESELGLRCRERNEFLLWHGTKPDVVDIIATDGFDERVCALGGLFGAGVYAAEEVSKSDQYVTPTPKNDPRNGVYHIFLVRMTMGKFHSTSSAMNNARRAPPGFNSVLGQIDHNKYREFVIYDGWLAYPEFLIEYKRQYV